MRAFLLGLFLFGLFCIFGRWYYVCQIRGNCQDKQEQVLPIERENNLYLVDGVDTLAGPFSQFYYEKGSIEPTLNASNKAFLEEVSTFLEANLDRKIMLTGKYSIEEKNAKSGFFENIGIARAAWLEDYFEENGIDQKNIETRGVKVADTNIDWSDLFMVMPKTETDLYDTPQYRFEDNTFSDSNFKSGSAEFLPGEQFIYYADTVRSFLSENPDYVLTIIGHTDSVDTEEFNQKLGLDRANAAKQYFEELGVQTPIVTVSMGEAQFAAPNTFPDGKPNTLGMQTNRRVNFKLEQKEQ